jgi:hypothetical protein
MMLMGLVCNSCSLCNMGYVFLLGSFINKLYGDCGGSQVFVGGLNWNCWTFFFNSLGENFFDIYMVYVESVHWCTEPFDTCNLFVDICLFGPLSDVVKSQNNCHLCPVHKLHITLYISYWSIPKCASKLFVWLSFKPFNTRSIVLSLMVMIVNEAQFSRV